MFFAHILVDKLIILCAAWKCPNTEWAKSIEITYSAIHTFDDSGWWDIYIDMYHTHTHDTQSVLSVHCVSFQPIRRRNWVVNIITFRFFSTPCSLRLGDIVCCQFAQCRVSTATQHAQRKNIRGEQSAEELLIAYFIDTNSFSPSFSLMHLLLFFHIFFFFIYFFVSAQSNCFRMQSVSVDCRRAQSNLDRIDQSYVVDCKAAEWKFRIIIIIMWV